MARQRGLGCVLAALCVFACGDGKKKSHEDKAPPAADKPAAPRGKTVRSIAVGIGTSCALMVDGTVRCWGSNSAGQLGAGKTPEELPSSVTPVDVVGIEGARQLWVTASNSPSGDHTDRGADTACVLMGNGAVKCWGHNKLAYGDGDEAHHNAPTEVALTKIIDYDSRSGASCAVSADGTARCWGWNAFGRLGTGKKQNTVERPEPVKGMTAVQSVRCGRNHCCFLRRDGTVWCSGYNSSGQLGNGKGEWNSQSSVPVKVARVSGATQIAALDEATCATSKGNVVCWGTPFGKTPIPIPGAQLDVAQLDGTTVACALRKDRSVGCWGDNEFGQLGDGTQKARPIRAAPVKGLANATQIAVGVEHACALLADGRVRCWGKNSRGQLGDGTLDDRVTPSTVKHLTDTRLPPAAATTQPTATSGPELTFADAPNECAKKNTLTVTAKGVAKALPIRSAFADPHTNGMAYDVVLANYVTTSATKGRLERGAQRKLRLGLERWGPDPNKKGARVQVSVDPGAYQVDWKAARRLYGMTGYYDPLSQKRFDKGKVEVRRADDRWVCGTVDLAVGSDLRVQGKFVAKVAR
jgi:alpha-tubulin suppressor-like RCC1 family protein